MTGKQKFQKGAKQQCQGQKRKKKKITGIEKDKEEEPRFWLDTEGKEEKK